MDNYQERMMEQKMVVGDSPSILGETASAKYIRKSFEGPLV
jgi:hypothetical protein